MPATLLFLLAWQVMIAAMMLPSSLPLLGLYATATARTPARERSMAAFIGRLRGGLERIRRCWPSRSTPDCTRRSTRARGWSERSWAIGGSVLVLAGLFQFTPLKDACLDKCRHPAQFLTRHYRRGPAAGFELGARHGAFCVGCCWALMLVMFAAGMTSLLWMAALTALMIHEKTRPSGARAVPLTGVALLAAASVVLAYGAATSGSL